MKCKGQELADIIEDRGYTVDKFCQIYSLNKELIEKIINCTTEITPDIAQMLHKATKFPDHYWL